MTSGRLIGIARRSRPLAPMQELDRARIGEAFGVEGDSRGAKYPRRRVTVLAREDFEAALLDLAGPAGPPDLPWTVRRANLLVEGIRLPRAKGAIIAIGPVALEVTAQTVPCERMNEAYPGLLKAFYPEWRGGVTCLVLKGGIIEIGERVELVSSPPEHVVRLPG